MVKYIFFEYEKIYSSIDSKSGFLILKETFLPKEIVELGSEGIVKSWKQAKLRAVVFDKGKKLEVAAKKSIVCKDITSSAKFEIKLLIEDYEYKQKQSELITEELNKLYEKIPLIKKISEIKGIGMA